MSADAIHMWQTAVMWVCVGVLATGAAAALCVLALRSAERVRRLLNGWNLAAFALAAAVCAFAAQKRGLVSYPRTEAGAAYLVDRDSYADAENGLVHLDWERSPFVPDTAALYVDARPRGSTNDAEWTNLHASTFARLAEMGAPPLEIPVPGGATNFEYAVYTDWTPGPAVATNGVWHTFWGMTTNRTHILPVRTVVYEAKEN